MSKASQSPLVSIVIPVYNGADYLQQAIESALAQSWRNLEVIVVDDGSEDQGRTAAIAASYADRIRYIHQPNGGTGSAVNTGIRHMRGEYFSWLSHDDVYEPDKIERQMLVAMKQPEPALIFSDVALMRADGEIFEQVNAGRDFDPVRPLWPLFEALINGCALLIHRQCFQRCGLMDPGHSTTHDYDMWFRICLEFPLIHAPGGVVRHRVHANQCSKRMSRHLDEVALMWRFMLDRAGCELLLQYASSRDAFYDRLLLAPAVSMATGLKQGLLTELVDPESSSDIDTLLYDNSHYLAKAEVLEELSGLAFGGNRLWFASAVGKELSVFAPVGLHTAQGEAVAIQFPPGEDLRTLLLRAAEQGQARFLLFTHGQQFDALDLKHAQFRLDLHADAVACLRRPAHTEVLLGYASAWDAAVFERTRLLRILREPCGESRELLDILSEAGAILYIDSRKRYLPSFSSPETSNTDGYQSGVLPASFPDWKAWLAVWLFGRPWRVSLLWRLARMLVPKRPQERLASLAGIAGRVDADWYRLNYPDVAEHGLEPVFHYLRNGCRQAYDPAPDFSTLDYLAANPDVASRGVNPLQHYALWGQRQARQAKRSKLGLHLRELKDDRPVVLLLLHDLGGGAARFAAELAKHLSPRLNLLFVCARGDGLVSIGRNERGRQGIAWAPDDFSTALPSIVRLLDVRRMLLITLHGFGAQLARFVRLADQPFDLIHLDYGFVCDNFHLQSENGHFLGDENLPESPWRQDSQRTWLLDRAARHYAISSDLAERLGRMGLERAVRVARPPDPHKLCDFRPWVRPLKQSGVLRIALMALIADYKGRRLLIECLQRIRARGLSIRFVVFGHVHPPVSEEFSAWLKVIPVEDASALTRAVVVEHPHLAWLPFQVPETHSYALSDAMANGLPIAASAIGAAVERLQERPLSWLLPWRSSADDWLNFFTGLIQDGFPEDPSKPPVKQTTEDRGLDYRSEIYTAVFDQRSVAG